MHDIKDFAEKTNASCSPDSIPIWRRRLVFIIIVYLQVLCNYDSGIIAAILGDKSFHQSQLEEGWLASAVYLGHIAGCVFTGSILNHWMLQYRIKWVLATAMFINAGCIYFFAYFTDSFWIMLVSRVFSGMTASMLVVYAPLWVDDYAPESSTTMWMSILQAAVPVGVMLGYVITGTIQANTNMSYQYSFYFQCLCLLPAALGILLVPNRHVNLQHVIVVVSDDQGGAGGGVYGAASVGPPMTNTSLTATYRAYQNTFNGPSMGTQIKFVVRNPLFLATVFGLSSLYFVVTGLQLWATAYLTGPEPIHATLGDVVAAFGVTSITGPTIGVIIGGVLMDRSGGYAGNMLGATKIAAVCGTIAVGCAMAALRMTTLITFIVFVWFLLCAGGAVVPITTGLSIACIPKEFRNVSCSIAAIIYNLLGYFLGPLLCGMVSHYYNEDLRLGMSIVLGWSVVSWVCIMYAWYVVKNSSSVHAPDFSTQPPGVPGDNQTPETVSQVDTALLDGTLSSTLATLLNQPISHHDVQRGMRQAEAAPIMARRNSEEYLVQDCSMTFDSTSTDRVRRVSLIRPVRVVSLSNDQASLHRSFIGPTRGTLSAQSGRLRATTVTSSSNPGSRTPEPQRSAPE